MPGADCGFSGSVLVMLALGFEGRVSVSLFLVLFVEILLFSASIRLYGCSGERSLLSVNLGISV